ncbi:MAG: hypothetical protein KZQ95_10690 [Candidatus Thiodiazotropha sp. (ex Epidulcina cf. delphinae)]|nr:hypothetical protein [Candidatus Thiodiazotropha sp. (ex Epidulcina cf. delphinae)]
MGRIDPGVFAPIDEMGAELERFEELRWAIRDTGLLVLMTQVVTDR